MPSCEPDFHQWIGEQAALLKAGQFGRLDVPHLIDEVESMSARERRELIKRFAVLLAHLAQVARSVRTPLYQLASDHQPAAGSETVT
jgi:hypothetical protein